MEILKIIAILCQVGGSTASSSAQQELCQKRLVMCVLANYEVREDINLVSANHLAKCIVK